MRYAMNRTAVRSTWLAAASGLTLAVSAHAQLGSFNPNPGPQGTFAIRGGTVVTVSGAYIPNGTVVISAGSIDSSTTSCAGRGSDLSLAYASCALPYASASCSRLRSESICA